MTTTHAADPRARRRTAADGQPPRRVAKRAPELAPLALDELRAYRQELITEEARVSYWRRLVQARLDLAVDDETALGRLRTVLTDQQRASRRLAVQPVDGHVEMPPVPDLAVLWEREGCVEVASRLADAEHELSAYRRGLHERLDAATGELIARYRDEPSLALRALPLPPDTEAGVA